MVYGSGHPGHERVTKAPDSTQLEADHKTKCCTDNQNRQQSHVLDLDNLLFRKILCRLIIKTLSKSIRIINITILNCSLEVLTSDAEDITTDCDAAPLAAPTGGDGHRQIHVVGEEAQILIDKARIWYLR